jgi:hypothetical protein
MAVYEQPPFPETARQRFERHIKNQQTRVKYQLGKAHAELAALQTAEPAPVVSIIEGRNKAIKSEQEKRASKILGHIRKLIRIDVAEAQRIRELHEYATLKAEQRRRDPAYQRHILLKEKLRRLELKAARQGIMGQSP